MQRARGPTKFPLSEGEGELDAASRNLAFSKALDGSNRNKIAEAVESLTPASPRPDKSQPFPIAKTARLNTQNAPCFSSRIALRQTGGPLRRAKIQSNDYAPNVNPYCRALPGICVWLDVANDNQKMTSSCAAPTAC